MSPFGKLFWGFLLVLLDFTINGFDILIDLIGYILIVVGLGEIAARNRNFERARPFAIVLLGLSVLDLFQRAPTGSSRDVDVGLFGNVPAAIVFSLALSSVNLLLVYYICSGISELARAIGNQSLSGTAMSRWQLFLWTQVAAVVFLVISFASRHVNVGFLLIVVIAGVLATILIAGLMRRADKAFYPSGS